MKMCKWRSGIGVAGGAAFIMLGAAISSAQEMTYPTAATTGVPAGTTLTTVSSVTLSTNGQVLENTLVTGDVIVRASNVIIRNSEIRGRVQNSGTQSFTIEDSTVGPTSGCNSLEAVGYGNYTARRVRIRNFGDGFRVGESNIIIADSFVQLCSNPGDHSDGVQGYNGGTNVTVQHNTIDQRGATSVNAPIFFADNSKSATIQNNLIMGGAISLRVHDDYTPDVGPWIVTGNRIVNNSWNVGPVSTDNTDCATTTWSDNRIVTIDSNYKITSLGNVVTCSGNTTPPPTAQAPGPPSNVRVVR